MNKKVMFNEYEAVTQEAQEDFRQVDSDIAHHIKTLAEKYKLIEIEQYLMSTVSSECAELRLRNAMKLKTERRNEKRAQLKSQA